MEPRRKDHFTGFPGSQGVPRLTSGVLQRKTLGKCEMIGEVLPKADECWLPYLCLNKDEEKLGHQHKLEKWWMHLRLACHVSFGTRTPPCRPGFKLSEAYLPSASLVQGLKHGPPSPVCLALLVCLLLTKKLNK